MSLLSILIFSLFVIFLYCLLTPIKKKAYQASFGNSGDVLSSFNKGFCATGTESLTRKASYQNFLVNGPTGAFKTTTTIIPSLYKMDGPSFVVFDPSGEIFNNTSGCMAQKGYDVSVLSFSNPAISQGFNPLARVHTSSEIHRLATLITRHSLGGKHSGDPFWATQSANVIAILIMILKEQPEEYQNLSNVRYLLNIMAGKPELLDALFVKTKSEELYSEWLAISAYDSKLLTNIIASAQSALQLFKDENVAKLTANDTISLETIRKRKRIVYIQSNLMDQSYLRPLFAAFIEAAFTEVLSRLPNESDNDLFFLFDEAGSLWLPNLAMMVSNCRKFRCGILAVTQQGLSQLSELYGQNDAKTIRANCMTHLHLSGVGLETATEIEQLLGKTTIKEDTDKGEREVVRPLMLHNEIRQISDRQGILLVGNKPPYLVKVTPFFKNLWIKDKSKIPPPDLTRMVSMNPVKLLPLEPVNEPKHAEE